MNDGFRLLTVTVPQVDHHASLPPRTLEIAEDSEANSSWTSVVIGRNGVGKSRLLAAVTATLDDLDRDRKPSPLTRQRITYRMGRHLCEFDSLSQPVKARIDGRRVEPTDLPLPRRVAAVTTAPFDKFRVPPRPGSRYEQGPEAVYRYLGLRDFAGRASPTAAVFRALNELFAASVATEDRRNRIASVFAYLGYYPSIEVSYRWTARGQQFTSAVVSEDYSRFPPTASTRLSNPSAFERMAASNSEFMLDAARITRVALERMGTSSALRLHANFEDNAEDAELFARLQLLRRAELIAIQSVLLRRLDTGATIDLRDTSSGELALVTGFLGIASAIDDSSLVVIDEPEISLHPEWQTQYLELLNRTFADYRSCHFIVATHSPLVVSDVSPTQSTVVSLDSSGPATDDSPDFSGKSADYVLLQGFNVANEGNLYLKQVVIEALRLAADGEIHGDAFDRRLQLLQSVAPKLGSNSHLSPLVAQLQMSRELAEPERS